MFRNVKDRNQCLAPSKLRSHLRNKHGILFGNQTMFEDRSQFAAWRKAWSRHSGANTQGCRQRGPVVPGPPVWNRCPPFHVWPTSCCIHPILYFKNVPPLLVFGPSFCFLAPLLVNPGDEPANTVVWWHNEHSMCTTMTTVTSAMHSQ